MRLTLRTLLAYLDDTLEPSEIKKIGQKVAESDAAQELIARLKQVTRRRRLTTPPATGPNSFDPNLVAEYLDNELSSEQLAELEKICLESDVHLAEVASCHQILTLVLGEPALVPPTAKERMYALVQGREAIPFRKASTAGANASAPTSADADADEMFLLGLPFYRRSSWLRWALPVAGVLLLGVVAVALWRSISDLNPPVQPGPIAQLKPENTDEKPPTPKEVPTPIKSDVPPPVTPVVPPPANTEINPPPAPPPAPQDAPHPRKEPPSAERVEVGSYYFDPKSPDSILVQRKKAEDDWQRVRRGARVSSKDSLISLPGYASELRLDKGVHLLLRGHVREFSLPEPKFADMDYLQESAVILHKNKDFDVDVTFLRGRLYLSNHKDKGPAVVRLRFEKEVWDLTLEEPGSEVAVDLFRRNRADIDYTRGEDPLATLFLLVLQGKANLSIDYNNYPNLSRTGPALFLWGNKGIGVHGPDPADDEVRRPFAKLPPVSKQAEEMDVALKQLSKSMLPDRPPIVVLEEVLQRQPSMEHRLAIYCLGALDDIKELIKVLGSTDTRQIDDRDTAIITLRRWLGRDAHNGPLLYSDKKDPPSGLLLSSSQEYRADEAKTIFKLLHDFNVEDRENPETYVQLASSLLSEKAAIAELAHWQLYRLSRLWAVQIPSLEKFNASAPRDVREKVADEVDKLVLAGKLPPQVTQLPQTRPGTDTGPRPGTRPKK